MNTSRTSLYNMNLLFYTINLYIVTCSACTIQINNQSHLHSHNSTVVDHNQITFLCIPYFKCLLFYDTCTTVCCRQSTT